ncbi:response regulator [Methanophagales archaeon]|nr:MAG: response regulator [Methanophagales archaeon]
MIEPEIEPEISTIEYTILVVDDERRILQAIKRILRREPLFKYKVLTADNAKDALKIVESEKVDLILSDQRMPEMTGVELFNKVREISPQTVRMLITGYTDLNAAIEAINKAKIDYYIEKPWDDIELLNIIRNGLNRPRSYVFIKPAEGPGKYIPL